ncbi:MAG: hypothetical protein ACNS62_10425 [Candidatus Cyclobacteriaceae bacterium M3_2C_046]
MKLIKNTIIALGIIVAIITLSASISFAHENKASTNMEMKQLENELIENYLENIVSEQHINEKSIKIFDTNDQLIYQGSSKDQEAALLLLSCSKLTEINQEVLYITN